MDDYQHRFVDTTLTLLKEKCSKGEYHDRLFKRVIAGLKRYFTIEKLEWMREYVNHPNQMIAAACLESLCTHGAKVSEFADLIEQNYPRRSWCEMMILMAEKQNDPNVLLAFLDEKYGYINRVIIALKNTKNDSYLTTLLLSDNVTLASAVDRMIKK